MDLIEQRKAKELVKQTNEIMLGVIYLHIVICSLTVQQERDALAIESAAPPAAAVSSMMAGSMLGHTDSSVPAPMEVNIVQQFLMQREEPRPLFTEMSVKDKDPLVARAAAAYNANLFFDRNWREATTGLSIYTNHQFQQ